MFDKSKLIILVTGTNIEPYDKNWKESEKTWIPELRKLGYNIKISIGVPSLSNYYLLDNDKIYFKTYDTKDGLVDKSIKLPIKWILAETKYQYYMRIDSDSFVAPLRFEKMLNENFIKYGDVDYMGCSIPVDMWWDKPPMRFHIMKKGIYASGAAYFLSKKAMILADRDMRIDDDKELQWDDLVLGRAMWENNIPLLHDGRILLHSKYYMGFQYPNNEVPDISIPNSYLAIQHYMNGHMDEAKNKLGF